ncbi:hypothetical protein Y032_0036g3297 [Ancylostoma ceylanicum]|uniref:Uncharacterized protein n=1 Tax=Ancylostoma ceylanicum TaxID=53326 RepID=A0A016ULG7_9BILA|nr:hypothetical protein Y032_0036g3297 [Ancylostoma ceylanicum]
MTVAFRGLKKHAARPHRSSDNPFQDNTLWGVLDKNPDSTLRRQFHRERRGRVACFSMPWKGHCNRRPLQL